MRNSKVAIHQAQLTAPQEQIIDQFFDSMGQILDFGEALRPVERRNVVKLHRQNLIFVREGMEAIEEIPEILPFYSNSEVMKERFGLHEQMRLLEDKTAAFLEKVRDLRYVLGGQCWEDGMTIYDAAKLASKNRVPKADYYYEKMRVRFQKQGNFRSKKNEEDGQEGTPIEGQAEEIERNQDTDQVIVKVQTGESGQAGNEGWELENDRNIQVALVEDAVVVDNTGGDGANRGSMGGAVNEAPRGHNNNGADRENMVNREDEKPLIQRPEPPN